MRTKDLRNLSKEKLIEKKKELETMIMGSYAEVKPTLKPEQRKTVRRTIAKINTILKEKK